MLTISTHSNQTDIPCCLPQNAEDTLNTLPYTLQLLSEMEDLHKAYIRSHDYFDIFSTPDFSIKSHTKSRAPLFNKLKKKIESYLDLTENWDQSNGFAPQATTVKDAILLLEMIKKQIGTHIPHISATGDNEICFEWRNKTNVLYMFCRGKKTFNVMHKIYGKRNYRGSIPLTPAGIPQEFIKVIEQVFTDE